MRLKREKIISTKPVTSTKPIQTHHNKTASMDVTCIDKTKNIYLNKILQKNFGGQKLPMEPANFQKNYPNFQSDIQRILANEESRQKAKNFVIQMRYKQQNSPYVKSEYNKNQNYLLFFHHLYL